MWLGMILCPWTKRTVSSFLHFLFYTCRFRVYKLHHIYNCLSWPLKTWYNYQNTLDPKPGPWLTQIQLAGTQDISPTKLSEDWKWIPIHHPSISNPSRKYLYCIQMNRTLATPHISNSIIEPGWHNWLCFSSSALWKSLGHEYASFGMGIWTLCHVHVLHRDLCQFSFFWCCLWSVYKLSKLKDSLG